jgi:16S rRNA (uracil1498-N3)-methyltransferase
MRIHRFFVDQQLPAQGKVKIQDEELVLFDLTGAEFRSAVTSLGSKADKGADKILEVEILSSQPSSFAPRVSLNIFLSLPKRDVFEWIIEKGTEVGVTGFNLILSERSEKKYVNMERTKKIATEACEQSGRSIRPHISEAIPLESAIQNLSGTTFALDPRGTDFKTAMEKSGLIKTSSVEVSENSASISNKSVNVFVGPEGGFSESEIELFKSKNIPVYSLGKQILRVETAAIVVASGLLIY